MYKRQTQYRAFAGVEAGGDGGVEAGLVAEREVDEDGRAQPSGLRNDDLRHPAGDQAVEQDDRTVRQPPEDAGEFGPGGGVRPGPVAGHGQAPHPPAEAGQVEPYPPVVGVAAARGGRVVDAAGHDEVHGAQGHGDDPPVPRGRVVVRPGRPGGSVGGPGPPADRGRRPGAAGHSARS